MSGLIPLTPIEKYIYFADQLGTPWNMYLKLIFEGQLDKPILAQAINTTLQRHSLLSSIVVKRHGMLHWQPIAKPKIEIEELNNSNLEDMPEAMPIDLRARPGLRVFIKYEAYKTALFFHTHHACCDGQGFISFVWDLLWTYEQISEGLTPTAKPRNLERLKARYRITKSPKDLLLTALKQLPGIIATASCLFKPPQKITENIAKDCEATDKPFPQAHSFILSSQQTRQLASQAKKMGVTVNAVLLRDLLTAVAKWKQAHGFDDETAWFRAMVPFSERTLKDYREQAFNKFSMVFIERKQKALRKRKRLLERLSEDFSLIKKLELNHTFLLILKIANRIPGGIQAIAKSSAFRSSMVFSNMGKLRPIQRFKNISGKYKVGACILEGIAYLPVIDRSQQFGVLANQYAGETYITAQFDPKALSDQQCIEILELFWANIQESING